MKKKKIRLHLPDYRLSVCSVNEFQMNLEVKNYMHFVNLSKNPVKIELINQEDNLMNLLEFCSCC